MRSSRHDRLDPEMSPGFRFLWGSSLLVLFLLQQEPLFKFLLVLFFAALARVAGKRIRFGYFLTLLATITLFNLLTPYGEVIAELGPLRVTQGALASGVLKGLTIVGLVFASLFTVSRRLVLPGSFGLFLARSFFYFELLYGEKNRLRRRHIVEDIDTILERVSSVATVPPAPAASRRTTLRGFIVALGLFVLVGASLFVPSDLFGSSPWL